MSKINVKNELWNRAHDLEAQAYALKDEIALKEAREWKDKLSHDVTTMPNNDNIVQPKNESHLITGNGVKGCLNNVEKALKEVTGDAERQ